MHSSCSLNLQVSLYLACVHKASALASMALWLPAAGVFAQLLGITPGCPRSTSSCRLVPDSTARQHVSCCVHSQRTTLPISCNTLWDARFGQHSVSLLGYLLTPECFDIEVIATAVSTSRHHAAGCRLSVQLATSLLRLSGR